MSLIYNFKNLPRCVRFIYCLIDPRTYQVRYVGRASNKYRPFSHFKDKAQLNKKTHCTNWIKSINGEAPIVEILEFCNNNDELNYREQYWIEYYKKFNSKKYRLTNYTEGGGGILGYKHTKEAKLKISRRSIQLAKQKAVELVDQYGNYYASIIEAATRCKASRRTIQAMINNKSFTKFTKGYAFAKYKNSDGSINLKANTRYLSKEERLKIKKRAAKKFNKPVREIGSSFVYFSLTDLASDLNLSHSTVSHHLRGAVSHIRGKYYEFYTKV